MVGLVKAFVFDVGGVLVNYDSRLYYQYLSESSGVTIAKISRLVKEKIDIFEKGRMSIASFEKYISKNIGIAKDKVRWYEFYKEHVTLDHDMPDLINMLRKDYGYRIAYLTNIDKSKYYYSLRILNLDKFDYRFASCYIGLRKPDPRIYEYVLGKMVLKPQDIVFIDNEKANVDSALNLGMKAVLFENRRKLEVELGRMGV